MRKVGNIVAALLFVLVLITAQPIITSSPQDNVVPQQKTASVQGYLTPESIVSEVCDDLEGAEIVHISGESYSDYWAFRVFLQCSHVNTVTARYNPFYDPIVPLTRIAGPTAVSNASLCRSQGASLSAFVDAAREFGFVAIMHKPCNALIHFYREGVNAIGIDVLDGYWDGGRCNMTSECSPDTWKEVLRILPVKERSTGSNIFVPLNHNDTHLVSAIINTPMVLLSLAVTIYDNERRESALTFMWSHALSSGMKSVLHVAHDLGAASRAFYKGLSVTTEYICAEHKFYAQVANQFVNSFGLLSPVINIRDNQETLDGAFASSLDLHQSDKYCHGYHRFYPHFVSRYKAVGGEWSGQLSMLEIGVFKGASIKAWREYFPDVFVFAIDIFRFGSGDGSRIYVGDQSDIPFLRRVKREIDSSVTNKLFLIVDDGSHRPAHQVASFDYLFSEVLMFGGTYIIEDVETSYWAYKDNPDSTIDVFKQLVDDMNYKYWKHIENETESNFGIREKNTVISPETKRFISTITFGQNCISIVKKTFEELVIFDDMTYRFKDTLGRALTNDICFTNIC